MKTIRSTIFAVIAVLTLASISHASLKHDPNNQIGLVPGASAEPGVCQHKKAVPAQRNMASARTKVQRAAKSVAQTLAKKSTHKVQ